MLKIYGADLSSPSNKVRFVANYLELEYEYVKVSLRDGEHRKEEFLKLNPVGKIPVIEDDGFILFESDAIVKYLCTKNGSPLYPRDLQQRALVDQWTDFVSIHIGMALGKVLFNRIFAPFAKVPVDEKSISDGLMFLNRFLPVVDNQLKTNPFLTGGDLTIADMCLLANLDPAGAAGVHMERYPEILRWMTSLQKETFYTRCHASYEEGLEKFKKR